MWFPTAELGITQIRTREAGLPAPTERPASELPFSGNREPGGNQGAVPSSSGERPRRSSHLSRQPEVSDAWEGRGHRGRELGGQTPGGCALKRCSWATRTGQLAAASQDSREKRAAIRGSSGPPTLPLRCRSRGTRTTERKEGAPAAAPHLPRSARPRCPLATRPPPLPRPPEQRAHTHHLAKFKGAGRTGGGGPAPGAEWGRLGEDTGRGREQQVLQLPSLPTAGPRGGQRALSANEFTFFFSPALSPFLFSPAPQVSSLAAKARLEFSVLGLGAGGWRR